MYAQEQTFKLKNGTVIIGKVQEETDLTMQVQTKFGLITINKDDLIYTEFKIHLNSGETVSGIKEADNAESIILKTSMAVAL